MSLSVENYFQSYAKANGGGPIYSPSEVANNILK